MKNIEAQIGSAIFCNSVNSSDFGKLDCLGVFTSFYAWAFPTVIRTWSAVVTLYNLPEGTSSVAASIYENKNDRHSLATADVVGASRDLGNTIVIYLAYKFGREGDYIVEFNLIGTQKIIQVPLRVILEKWPSFTKKELEHIRLSNMIPKAIRANVICSNCSRPYNFEVSPLPDHILSPGVQPFPKDGLVICESCGTQMFLKDLQGQMLAAIKNTMKQFKGSK